ncbi:malate dehydrogenase (plasmid) [Haloferacaceae archaeon DSL9]
MEVAIIGGGGTVGCTTAYTLAVERPEIDITLIDVAEDIVRGHETDIRHARTLNQLPSFTPTGRMNTVETRSFESGSLSSADIAIIAASVSRPSGSAKRGGRAKFLEQNQQVTGNIAELLREREPLPVIVVSNPVDRITYHVWRETGWNRGYFIGYSLSETARTADKIADIRGVSGSDVYCPVVGEHGENVVPLFSRLSVNDEPVTLCESDQERVREYVRNVPYDVISLRGSDETSRWVTGQGVARLACAIADGGIDGEPIALSVPLAGEYNFEDVCLSVPVELGRMGVEQVLEWDLPDRECEQLNKAYESIRTDL